MTAPATARVGTAKLDMAPTSAHIRSNVLDSRATTSVLFRLRSGEGKMDMSTAFGFALFFAATTVFFALALSGALIQRRALIRRLNHLTGESNVPERLWGHSVLLISKGCRACAAALVEVREHHQDAGVVVLASSDEGLGPDVSVDSTSWMKLFPGYTPCLVRVSPNGQVLSQEPVGSAASLREHLRGSAVS